MTPTRAGLLMGACTQKKSALETVTLQLTLVCEVGGVKVEQVVISNVAKYLVLSEDDNFD